MPYNLSVGLPILDDGSGVGVKSTNQEWFTSDIYDTIQPLNRRRIRIHFAVNTVSVVEYTLDSGSTWIAFNNKQSVNSNTGYEFELCIENDDLFNIRATQALTVLMARVDIVI